MSSDINVQTFSGKVNITSNLLVGSSHLFVDTINNRVGLVTNTPSAGLHVNSNAYVHTDFRVGSGIVMNDTTGRITAGAFHGDGTNITGINSDSGSWVNGTDVVYLSTIGDKVGIGTTSPDKLLEISGASGLDNSSPVHFRITNTQSATSASPFTDITKPSGLISFYTPDTSTAGPGDVAGIGFRPESTLGGDTALCFYTNSENDDAGTPLQERMCITHDGNVGIGTTSPLCMLTIDGGIGVNSGGGVLGIRQKGDTLNDGITLTSSHGNSTRMYKDASGHFNLYNTGGGQFTFENVTGNVGIGTASPEALLHVQPTSTNNTFIKAVRHNDLSSTKAIFAVSEYQMTGMTATGTIIGNHNRDIHIGPVFDAGNTVGSSTHGIRIKSDGNVGIGTTSPEAKLHVKGGSICVHRTFPDTPDAGIVFMEDHSNKDCMFIAYDAGGTAETSNESLRFYSKSAGGADPTISGANLLMSMRADGNVGIGTTSPAQKLDVAGRIRANYNGGSLQLVGTNHTYIEYYPDGASSRKAWVGYGGGSDNTFTINNDAGSGHVNIGSGNVGIGTGSPGAKLDVQGTTKSYEYRINGVNTNMYNAGGLWGMRYNTNTYSWHRWNGPHHFDLYSNSSFTAAGVPFYINYYSNGQVRLNNTHYASDDRIKTNEKYITNATETLLKLKPQIYDKGVNLGCESGETRVESGLIAQDVYYDTPELRHLVGYHDDAEIPEEKPYVDDDPQKDPDYSMWGSKSAAVDYVGLIAYLVKSNQEIYIDLQTEKVKTQEIDADLQTEKTENEITRLKLANAENRISILEQSLSSILSKLNI